jgi:hypothetical protein
MCFQYSLDRIEFQDYEEKTYPIWDIRWDTIERAERIKIWDTQEEEAD